ncbi:CWC16 protein [Naviculisporaceae sp. PSN 640]
MSERKVLAKYYPPDFDPSLVGRSRGPKQVGPKVSTVRLMSPFSMKCTTCGEFIYRGRKFNARKEIPLDEKYLNIQIFRFYIRCTRCSGEIVFKTDPRNQDYTVEKGAKRNVDPWKRGLGNNGTEDETDEQRLDRIEREMAAAEGEDHMVLEEKNAMAELEAKTADAKREMAVADALDEIRSRNARLAKAQRDGVEIEAVIRGPSEEEERRRRQEEEEDAEAARRAFAFARTQEMLEEPIEEEMDVEADGASGSNGAGSSKAVAGFVGSPAAPDGASETKPEVVAPKPAAPPAVVKAAEMPPPPPTFERKVKKKKDHAALLGIKKKPSLV